jgi:regulator of nucleoside diphosphate kinase
VHSRNANREISRPRIVIKATQHARLMDIAENAMRQGLPVAEYLMEELSRAHVVPDDACSPHVVQMGSHVTYTDDVAGQTHRVSVVYPSEANIDEQRISVLTPIGAALIGMSPAQCIHWRDPDGRTRILTVLDVRTG